MRLAWLMVVIALASCGGAAAPMLRPQTSPSDPRRAEIARLDARIGEQRRALSLQTAPVCPQVCEAADSICHSQEEICRIAGELGNDPWARDKCISARESCAEARKRCQGCR